MFPFNLFSICLLAFVCSSEQPSPEASLLQQVEAFRLALISGKRAELAPLVSDKLRYGHSSGRIEDKEAFLKQLESGASDFVSIEFAKQAVQISGKVAIVAHELLAENNDKGMPGKVTLHVMLVWQREGKTWKLLARQATRL